MVFTETTAAPVILADANPALAAPDAASVRAQMSASEEVFTLTAPVLSIVLPEM